MPLNEVSAPRAASNAAKGSLVDELVKAHNDLAERFQALLEKIDDEGTLSEDFEAEVGSPTVILPRP